MIKTSHPQCLAGVATQAPLSRVCLTSSYRTTLSTTCQGDGRASLDSTTSDSPSLGWASRSLLATPTVASGAGLPLEIQALFMASSREKSWMYSRSTHGGLAHSHQ